MFAFIRLNFRWIAGGFLLTYFSSFGQTFFVSGSVAEWQGEFGLSHGEFGRLYMLATLGSALCLPVAGRLVDVVPEHRSTVLVVPALALATLMAAFASSIVVLALAIFLLRLFGQGMMTHVALTATGRWFSAQRGQAVSLVVLGHQAGEATLPLIFAKLNAAYGFRMGWVTGCVALLLVALPFATWAYLKPRLPHQGDVRAASQSAGIRSWTCREVLRDPLFWTLLIGVLAPPFIGTTIFYHQDYLTELRGWPPQLFALSLTVMALTTVVIALITGRIVDRWRATVVLPFFLLPLALTCFALAIDGPSGMLFFVMVLLGISYGASTTLFGAVWPEIYGTVHLGAIRSVIVSAMVFATAAGPGLTGTLIDWGIEFPHQLMVMGIYCAMAAMIMGVASFRLRRRSLGTAKFRTGETS